MKNKKSLTFAIVAASFYLLFIILTVLLKTVDVKILTTTSVGLSSLNNVFLARQYNLGIDLVTDIIMYLSILSFAVLAGIGIYQWVTRKSLAKVDKSLFVIAGLAILMIGFYLFFDKVLILNYRPMMIKDKLEPSYPSTHTLITTFLSLAALSFFNKYLNKKSVKIISLCVVCAFIAVVAIGRMASGAHYLTDVLGGLFLGLGLYFTYETINTLFFSELEVKEEE